nr:hypothetical protein [Tanacetum cinerariifolium]
MENNKIRIIGGEDTEGDGGESGYAMASAGGGVREIDVVDTSDVDGGNDGSGSGSHGIDDVRGCSGQVDVVVTDGYGVFKLGCDW